MVKITKRTYDSIRMSATGVKDSRTCKFKLTWAFGGLSAYNETDGCWETEWEWDYA